MARRSDSRWAISFNDVSYTPRSLVAPQPFVCAIECARYIRLFTLRPALRYPPPSFFGCTAELLERTDLPPLLYDSPTPGEPPQSNDLCHGQ